MRTLIAIEFLTLDGVMQGPGGPDEDTTGGFAQGGWAGLHADPVSTAEIFRQMALPFDLLLGRKTYDIWAPYWPLHGDVWPQVDTAAKYVVSRTLKSPAWKGTTVWDGDIRARVEALKQTPGPNLHVFGSSVLFQELLRWNLVDELWLRHHPVVLGPGKRLFSPEGLPAAFTLTDRLVSPRGVIFATYRRDKPAAP